MSVWYSINYVNQSIHTNRFDWECRFIKVRWKKTVQTQFHSWSDVCTFVLKWSNLVNRATFHNLKPPLNTKFGGIPNKTKRALICEVFAWSIPTIHVFHRWKLKTSLTWRYVELICSNWMFAHFIIFYDLLQFVSSIKHFSRVVQLKWMSHTIITNFQSDFNVQFDSE